MKHEMTKDKDIQLFCNQLIEAFQPDRIILFGSHASGSPGEDSDVDLLVVMEHTGKGMDVAAHIIERLKPRFSVDLIVKSEEELENRLIQQDFFLQEALRGGRIIYEAAHA